MLDIIMRFQVPQFIDVEDKIFGPLTLKQFVYLAGTGGLVFISFAFLPKFFAIIIGGLAALLGLALAFYRVDNRPFIIVLESAFNYILGHRLYLWKKENKPIMASAGKEASALISVPKVKEGKLKDLAWNLDVRESIYSSKDQK